MKGTRFLGIRIALAACVLALLLVVEAGFVSVAWAGKPPRRSTTKYGYAMFRNATGDAIISDEGGQYIDCVVEFVVEPDVSKPGEDPKAITQVKVNEYDPNDEDTVYWYTTDEPAQYIIYTIDYGENGFAVEPVKYDRKGKPTTWKISPTNNPNLYVRLYNFGDKVPLQDYPDGVPFELAVSLNPLTTYPGVSGAPRKYSTLSATWGEIKAK